MSHPFDATRKELLAPNPDDFVQVFGLPRLQAACSTSTLSAATDVAMTIADRLREHELEQIYRAMDAEDPNWRWAEIVEALPTGPDEENAFVQMRKVDDLLKKTPFARAPAWSTPAKEKARSVRNARLSVEDAETLQAAFQPLDPQVLAEVRKLKDFPKGFFKIDPALNFYLEMRGDDLGRAQKLKDLLASDVMLRTHDNDLEGAVESWHALLHTSHAIGEHPHLLAQLLRALGQISALDSLERLLGQGELAEANLAKIQALLKRETNDDLLLYHGLRGERAGSHQMYLHLRDGKIPVAKLMAALIGGARFPFWERLDELFPESLSKGYPEHMHLFNEYVNASKLKEEDRLDAMQALKQKQLKNHQDSGFMTRMFMPATGKVVEAHHRASAGLRCALVSVALERYRVKHNAWPNGFDDLLKDHWLDAVPNDPYDGKPLRFQRTPTGVIIYAVGLDKIDNQGKLDRSTPNAPGTNVGFQLWDRQVRATAPPVENEK